MSASCRDGSVAGHGVAQYLTQHFFLPAETTLTPHNLLARLLVSSGAPGEKKSFFFQDRAGQPRPERPGQRCFRGWCQEPWGGSSRGSAELLPSGEKSRLVRQKRPCFSALCTQVVAGSPFAGSELQAAALLVMQSLHSRIHGAVGATWNTEIPLLLQYLQGKVLVGRAREGMASQLPSMAKGNPRLVPSACLAAVSLPGSQH